MSDQTNNPLEGSWGLKIDNVGRIAFTCRTYNSNINCRLFWIFSELPVKTEIIDNKLKIYTDETGEDTLLISLIDGRPHRFLQSSIITDDYIPQYSSYEIKNLKNAGIGSYADITDFRRHGSDYNTYHERGSLIELPLSLPGWIMNPAAYIFKNEKTGSTKGLNRILAHPSLTEDTMRDMYQFIHDEKDSPKSYLSIIGRNPSTGKDVLNKLFYKTSESIYSYMTILHAVANNPKSPPEYKTEYIKKVKTGGTRIQQMVVSNQLTSPETLDWIARNGSISLSRNQIFHHHNIWPQTLEYLLEQPISEDSIRSIAGNKNISDESLLKLAKKQYKNKHEQGMILEIISKYEDRAWDAVNVALERLAESDDISRRRVAARDKRISRSLIEQLINSAAISVRQELAGNQALTLEDLLILANDDYAVVAKAARIQLKDRFKNEHKKAAAGFKPESELNSALSLNSELNLAIRSNDVGYIDQVIKKYKTITSPPYSIDVTSVLASNNRELAEIVFSVSNLHFEYIIKNKEFNSDWLEYLLSINALSGTDDFKILSECVKLKRKDYISILLAHGYDINTIDRNTGQNILYTAIFMRDEGMLEFLLENDINTNIRDKRKMTPVNFAKRINFIDAIEILDNSGQYESEVARFKSQFTPSSDSMLIGKWSNLKGEFKTVIFDFHSDGTGKIVSTVSASLIAWKDIDGSKLLIIPITAGKLDESKQINSHYQITDDKLTLWINDNKKTVYYLVYEQSVTDFINDDRHKKNLKYVGNWVTKDNNIRLKSDGTATSGKNKFVWKDRDDKSVILLATDGDKIQSGKQMLLKYSDKQDVITLEKGSRSVILTREN